MVKEIMRDGQKSRYGRGLNTSPMRSVALIETRLPHEPIPRDGGTRVEVDAREASGASSSVSAQGQSASNILPASFNRWRCRATATE